MISGHSTFGEKERKRTMRR